MQKRNSAELFKEAQKLFPGGVNSPVRAFKSVGSSPAFISRASGSYLYDVDQNKYLDYFNSWGPAICGHAHPEVIRSIQETAQSGLSFGACHQLEIKLAQEIQKLVPSLEKLRFVNSGTEACMSLVRLARAFTKKDKIIKFSGCYHGHFDSFLVKAGSGLATFGLSDSLGVTEQTAQNTIVLPYNNSELLSETIKNHHEQIAAVILEPVVGNSGCILPQKEFLDSLVDLTKKHQVLLVFDEVMTGFRVSLGGAQELFKIKPDLSAFGKIIGGGLPVGVYGGRADIMAMISPEGAVYQAGTLSGNPLAMAAGQKTLELIQAENFYQRLEETGKALETGFREIFRKYKIDFVINRVGSMFSIFFTDLPEINSFEEAQKNNRERFSQLFQSLFEQGIYLPPSPFEACFFSITHGKAEIEKTLEAVENFCKTLKK